MDICLRQTDKYPQPIKCALLFLTIECTFLHFLSSRNSDIYHAISSAKHFMGIHLTASAREHCLTIKHSETLVHVYRMLNPLGWKPKYGNNFLYHLFPQLCRFNFISHSSKNHSALPKTNSAEALNQHLWKPEQGLHIYRCEHHSSHRLNWVSLVKGLCSYCYMQSQ